MLREARRILKENEEGWKERRTGEIRKIKEQEKRERLAIVAEKKKRYGLNTLNKEEKKRLGERTSERIEIANARANYWKLHRGGGNEMQWERIRSALAALYCNFSKQAISVCFRLLW